MVLHRKELIEKVEQQIRYETKYFGDIKLNFQFTKQIDLQENKEIGEYVNVRSLVLNVSFEED